MNRKTAMLIISLGFLAAQSYAREPQAPPSPTGTFEHAAYSIAPDNEKKENVFIGHYGETLRLYSDWTAEAVMRGPMEVIYMREKSLPPPSKWPTSVELKGQDATVTFHGPSFRIKPEEFISTNFARLRLMQLMVVPKNVPGGFRNLTELREAKSAELRATGSPHKLQEVGDYPWPPDSFWVSISTPYRLFQLYTQDDKNLFIFTSGASPYDEKPDDPVFGSAVEKLLGSLSTYLSGFRRQTTAERDLITELRTVLLPGTVVLVFAAILNFLPARQNWTRRLRMAGRTTAGFVAGWHIIAVPLLFASWRLDLDRSINEASILVCAAAIMPWVCKAISARFGGQRPWFVFTWSAVINVFPALLGFAGMEDFITKTAVIAGYQDFGMMTLTLSILGLLNGVAFGLTHQEKKTHRSEGAS